MTTQIKKYLPSLINAVDVAQRQKRCFVSLALSLCLIACGGAATPTASTVPTVPVTLIPEDYITIENGSLPVIISAPHGGETVIAGVPVRTSGTTVLDLHTYQLAKAIQAALFAKTGKRAYLVAALVSRQYIDFNRSADLSHESNALKPLYDRYYGALSSAVAAAKLQSPAAAVLIDVHGQGVAPSVVYRGTRDGKTAVNAALHTQPDGLITTMNVLGLGADPAAADGKENVNFNGGNIVWAFGKNNSNGINCVQFEFGYGFRETQASVDGTANKVADAIVAHLHANGVL